MERVYIGLGSNLGRRRDNINQGLHLLDQVPGVRVGAVSSFYETRAVGPVPQGDFINAVAALDTSLEPGDLLDVLLEVETRLGRVRDRHWGPRTLDLDILFFGRRVIDGERLKVPHPELPLRRFVLVPLRELAPDLVHPGLGRTVADLDAALADDGGVRRLGS